MKLMSIEEDALQEGAKRILLKLMGNEEDVLQERKKYFLYELKSMTQWHWRAYALQYVILQTGGKGLRRTRRGRKRKRGGKEWRRSKRGRKRKRGDKEWRTRRRGRVFWTSLMNVTGYVPRCVTLTNDACAS